LRERSDYQDVDLVVVADFDGVNTRICAQSVHSCWMGADWDVCAANQLGPYYDVWALRHPLWSPNDCWQQASFLRARGVSSFRAQRVAVYGRMIRLPSSAGWIEVDSAFGGLALYRRPCLEAVRYVGLDSAGEQVCEHVALHQQIRAAGGRIVINPALINADLVEHAVPATHFGTVKLWLGCRLRGIKRRLRGS
jgi:hypothetical protein